MKPNGDGPEGSVNESEETSQGVSSERMLSGPLGFRVVAETNVDELLKELEPTDRIHVVVLYDPQLGKEVGTVTVIRGESLQRLDEICVVTQDAFHVAIRKAAYTQVCSEIWGGRPPDETHPVHVFEVSPRELKELMESEMAHRASLQENAS